MKEEKKHIIRTIKRSCESDLEIFHSKIRIDKSALLSTSMEWKKKT